MGNGYLIPASDPIDQLVLRLRDIERRVSESESFTGAEIADALQTLTDLVNGLLTQVNGVFSGYLYSGGRGTFDGGVTSADVKARTLSVGYDSVYIDANNIMGKSPSARRFKQDVESYRYDPAVIDQIDGVRFRLIGAVEALGDDAKVEDGFIAEQLEDIGLGNFVSYDETGQPTGIAYERLTVPLVSAVQSLRTEVREIREVLGL